MWNLGEMHSKVFKCISGCYNQHFPLSAFHLESLDSAHDSFAFKYDIVLQSDS